MSCIASPHGWSHARCGWHCWGANYSSLMRAVEWIISCMTQLPQQDGFGLLNSVILRLPLFQCIQLYWLVDWFYEGSAFLSNATSRHAFLLATEDFLYFLESRFETKQKYIDWSTEKTKVVLFIATCHSVFSRSGSVLFTFALALSRLAAVAGAGGDLSRWPCRYFIETFDGEVNANLIVWWLYLVYRKRNRSINCQLRDASLAAGGSHKWLISLSCWFRGNIWTIQQCLVYISFLWDPAVIHLKRVGCGPSDEMPQALISPPV